MSNALNWFELPVVDMDRAVAFYERLLDRPLKRETFQGTVMAIFGSAKDGVGGALIHDARRRPSTDGALVYLDATGRLDDVLGRVAGGGGTIVLPKTDIGEPGHIALVSDTEGNVIGLHSPR